MGGWVCLCVWVCNTMVDTSVVDMISQQSLHKDMDEAPTPEEIYSAI